MDKHLMPIMAGIVLAAAALGCALTASPAPEVAPTAAPPPTETPPPIPTPLPTSTPMGEMPDVVEEESATTPVPGDTATIIFGSTRSGDMQLYLLAAGGFVAPVDIGGGLTQVTWPDVSPDGSRLAFVAVEGNAERTPLGIYTSDIDGSNTTRITTGDGNHPQWSADGSLLAYTCNNGTDICVNNAGGGAEVNITAGFASTDMYPDWTPDGRIVFMSDRDREDALASDIYIMNADGSDATRLTSGTDYSAYPSVSPDGATIAYESIRVEAVGAEIYLMDVTGDRIRRLTHDEVWNQNPIWSPDGSTLLYAAPDDIGNVDLYTIPVSGGLGPTQITENPAEDGGLRMGHAWLTVPQPAENFTDESEYTLIPDLSGGSAPVTGQIVFAVNDAGCPNCLATGIYTVTPREDDLAQLPVEGFYPIWSPDFTQVAYTRDGELFIANADGSDETQVTHAYYGLSSLDWHENEVSIVAECQPYDEPDVCIVDLTRGTISDITSQLSSESTVRRPAWLGDDIITGREVINRQGEVVDLLPAEGRISPDGTLLATIIDRQLAIWTLQGGQATPLTSGPATKGFPIWSPDGSQIVFTVAPGDGGLYMNIVRTDGSGASRFVNEAIAAGPEDTPPEITTYFGYGWAP
jgi:Tol biopolymer transport system component